MRVVIDVNVWVSGLLWGGVPGRVLTMAYTQQITSCVSEELLLELKITLEREKFSDRLRLRNLTSAKAVAIVQAVSETAELTAISVPELRDPADLKIAATAIAARATHLITGDQDLLVLRAIQNIFIVTPSQFVDGVALS
ncbi:putative toxin-antitoxin system toxin component, PIN family [Leptolyngbya sp. KIOST-1]|uniref:putative toxin-antitoxin system toxin component, PIN family n=1 Tax=Leptolyngbya sp. KIOST-1 TaxID=1229172 RepID=UPI000568B724|nr:putative toxin-antitoxin system toxin component, PIN family [Leptolyngbya sp. KIOST-1]